MKNPEPPPRNGVKLSQDERRFREPEAVGSNPTTPTMKRVLLCDRGDGYAEWDDGTLIRIAGVDMTLYAGSVCREREQPTAQISSSSSQSS